MPLLRRHYGHAPRSPCRCRSTIRRRAADAVFWDRYPNRIFLLPVVSNRPAYAMKRADLLPGCDPEYCAAAVRQGPHPTFRRACPSPLRVQACQQLRPVHGPSRQSFDECGQLRASVAGSRRRKESAMTAARVRQIPRPGDWTPAHDAQSRRVSLPRHLPIATSASFRSGA